MTYNMTGKYSLKFEVPNLYYFHFSRKLQLERCISNKLNIIDLIA